MPHVIVVGSGPAGLMAADVLSAAGIRVTILDRMPSLGRKLLMAGRGGLNLTHSEPLDSFLARYGAARDWLQPRIAALPPEGLVQFARDLGQDTFVGSSGRVFPKAMKASPLLRALSARLARQGVVALTRHRWLGHEADGAVAAEDASGRLVRLEADALILALGGASWPRLGSDGGWLPVVSSWGVEVAPLQPANAGVVVAWSEHFAARFAGTPVKRARIVVGAGNHAAGDLMITRHGLEGGPVYALSGPIAAAVAQSGEAAIEIDLRRDLDIPALQSRLAKPRGKLSVANWLRKVAQLPPVAIGLLREVHGSAVPTDPSELAVAIKQLRLRVTGFGGIERAISTAGGIRLDEVDDRMMLWRRPGVFVAGEMLDWQAPTGGYLLQACFATGYAAGQGALGYLRDHGAAASTPTGPPALNPTA